MRLTVRVLGVTVLDVSAGGPELPELPEVPVGHVTGMTGELYDAAGTDTTFGFASPAMVPDVWDD